jgi:hypothetical protein
MLFGAIILCINFVKIIFVYQYFFLIKSCIKVQAIFFLHSQQASGIFFKSPQATKNLEIEHSSAISFTYISFS